MTKAILTVDALCAEAAKFAEIESIYPEPSLYGVTDGKAVGTYIEQKFRAFLDLRYSFLLGNSASGVDYPDLEVDMKATAVTQPQSSCPFKSARQKIFGLGYHLLVYVYDKKDDPDTRSATLNIMHSVFIERHRTADFTMTKLIRDHLRAGSNVEDLIGLMRDKNLPVDEIEANNIADDLLKSGCEQGYLTISNALQWRLQYARAITNAGTVEGVRKLR